MPRTRSDGEQTRDRILSVALPLFADHGYAGTSVRTIAAAAGVNVATLAYHFNDKEGLYLTVVQHLHEQLAPNLPEVPAQIDDPRALLASLVATGWGFVREHQSHVRLLVRHVLDHGELPQVILDRWSQPAIAAAEAAIALFRPDWSTPQRRLLILSMMHVTVRLSLEDPAQVAQMTGLPVDGIEQSLVDWITSMLARQLGID